MISVTYKPNSWRGDASSGTDYQIYIGGNYFTVVSEEQQAKRICEWANGHEMAERVFKATVEAAAVAVHEEGRQAYVEGNNGAAKRLLDAEYEIRALKLSDVTGGK
jgi:hypothetical protein